MASALRASEFLKLQTASQFLLSHPQVRVRIEGNADERGGQEYNIALGDERGDAVRKYLIRAGVVESRLETLSYGEERPLCQDPTESCWQNNRRAQFLMR
jgi:peptidoglycan-associated lipoprotein